MPLNKEGRRLPWALAGCAIFFVAIIGLVIFKVFSAIASTSVVLPEALQKLKELKSDPRYAGFKPETFPVPGDSSQFDPFKVVPELRPKIGKDCRVYSIEADFVRSDGTMDLNATYEPGPHAKYKFYRQVDSGGQKEPPIGAGRRPDDVWVEKAEVEVYKPGSTRSITRLGGRTNSSVHYENLGMDISRNGPYLNRLDKDLGDPRISCADLWKVALTKGAPKDAVATITYNMNGYHFVVEGTPADLYFDFEGHLKH
jgi:hypothetical protein